MKDLITIGLPSKGRLKDKSISFFNDNGLNILQSEKERNYFGTIENKSNVKIIYLHAKEIASGGRYDDLLKSLGAKKSIPAVGAAINLKNI